MNAPCETPTRRAKDYRSAIAPVWCPGCGHFAVLSAVTKALAHLQLGQERVAMVSGIGCSSRLPAYVETYGFHGIHGRALPLASGLKAARPDLTVIVTGGDGDGFSIGGNHFLHACRRNMDLTYIVMDNAVYGMTKGQASPTTEADWRRSKLTPHGSGLRPFLPATIAFAAGASFIARGFAGDPSGLTTLLVAAIEHPGFAFLQVLSPCQTFRPEQKDWKQKVHASTVEPASDPIEAARFLQSDDGFALGVLYARRLPVWQPRNQVSATPADLEAAFLR
ncbi:2-oxoglutarate synthase [Thiocapsa imhoffii]|uniref:2-oxoglutarate synthase n=1 Tax=Thiocapsa imhoffii TaxID=382777 RepID=A0A9X0WG40_9GAMM|nr:2-oxoacid:ferredoxin oxidoreductase subunit beta [Thiocapsa imhoffii]MBK1643973.1 2-oxoglutarate synthase [Thiocapsa imhoffii]